MRAFAFLALSATALALVPVEDAGAPQSVPPSVAQPLFTANTTTTISSTISSLPAGNLSITKTTSTKSSSSQGITIITTSTPGGGVVTSTELVNPSSTTGSTSTATGTTQPGAASKIGNSAMGALALAVGVGAIFL